MTINTSSTSSLNVLENFDAAQYCGFTDMSTTPSMATTSIEEGTAHNPIFLSDVPIPRSPFNQPDCLVELSEKDAWVIEFKNYQNMFLKVFLNDICLQFCNLFCIAPKFNKVAE